jgi:hypothetical protein
MSPQQLANADLHAEAVRREKASRLDGGTTGWRTVMARRRGWRRGGKRLGPKRVQAPIFHTIAMMAKVTMARSSAAKAMKRL